jgi:hypothetical protein
MRAARPGIAHFTGDDTDRALPSGMTPPRAITGPVTPPNSRARRPPSLADQEHKHEHELFGPEPLRSPPNSHRRRSISGRGGYLPTPPPTPPLSPSE